MTFGGQVPCSTHAHSVCMGGKWGCRCAQPALATPAVSPVARFNIVDDMDDTNDLTVSTAWYNGVFVGKSPAPCLPAMALLCRCCRGVACSCLCVCVRVCVRVCVCFKRDVLNLIFDFPSIPARLCADRRLRVRGLPN